METWKQPGVLCNNTPQPSGSAHAAAARAQPLLFVFLAPVALGDGQSSDDIAIIGGCRRRSVRRLGRRQHVV